MTESRPHVEALLHDAALEPPDPAVRERVLSMRRASGRAGAWVLAGALATAGAVLVAVVVNVATPENPYRAALTRSIDARLAAIRSSDPVIEEMLALLIEDVEERIAGDVPEIALRDAPAELTSPVLARRVGARRALKVADPEVLAALKSSHPYVRMLAKSPVMLTLSEGGANHPHFVEIKQFESGAVNVVARDGAFQDVRALSFSDLARRHPEVCERFGIEVEGNWVRLSPGGPNCGRGESELRSREWQLDVMRHETVKRVKGEAVSRQIEAALLMVDLDEPLLRLREEASEQERAAAAALEDAWRRARRIEVLADMLSQ